MPQCCILCGAERASSVRVKLAPKRKPSFDQALKSASLLGSARRLIPTIPILLPFCAQHVRRVRLKQCFQMPLILCGFLVAVIGGVAFWNSHSIWPLPVSVAVMALLFFAAHHHQLRATEVSSHAISLAGVHETFADEFVRLNATLNPPAGISVHLDVERDFVPPSDCPYTDEEQSTSYNEAYRMAWEYAANNSYYEISGDGTSRDGQFVSARGKANELGFNTVAEFEGLEAGTIAAKDCYFRLVREAIDEFFESLPEGS